MTEKLLQYVGEVFQQREVFGALAQSGLMDNITAPNLTYTNNSGNESGHQQDENPYILPWWWHAVYVLLFAFMYVVATGGNVIVVWIVLAHKRMRTVTNYFLVNLAAADALISNFNAPFAFMFLLTQDWIFQRGFCKFSMFIQVCTISASVLTFMAIAIDRYVAIIHPLRPRLKAQLVIGIIVIIWLISFLLALPNLIYAETYTMNHSDNTSRIVCYLEWPGERDHHTEFAYNVLLMIVTYFTPLIALAVTYSRVGLELWGSRVIGECASLQSDRLKSKRKVVKMMIVVVVIFGVCWLPQHVFYLVVHSKPTINKYKYIQHLYIIIFWIAMSNSMYNPIIYCWMNARFRRGFLRVFSCCPCMPCQKVQSDIRMGRMYAANQSTLLTDKTDRNGSMMQTMVESIDDTSSTPGKAGARVTKFSEFKMSGDDADL